MGKIFPAPLNSFIRGLCLLNDGSVITTGFIDSEQVGYQFISDDRKGFVLKTDKHGNLIWDKELTSTPYGVRVEQTVDGLAIDANVWVRNSAKEHQQLCLIQMVMRSSVKLMVEKRMTKSLIFQLQSMVNSSLPGTRHSMV